MRSTFLTYLVVGATLFCCYPASAQNNRSGLEQLFNVPLNYVVKHADEKLSIDGKLNEKAWQHAEWTSSFTDIEGDIKPKPLFNTRVKMLWDDDYLFVAARLEEPQIWAMQQHHDDIIFRDNDFEIFIDPNNSTHGYFEIEVNALNKIFDLFLPKPYRNQGIPLIGWNADGLKSAIHLNGTLNKLHDHDKSWTVEMAIPLKSLWQNYPLKIPQEGSLWRINFSRVEWDTKVLKGKIVKLTDSAGHNLPEHNWVWSPQGVVNMHYPERWGYLQFTRKDDAVFTMPYAELQKNELWLIYYRQKQYLEKNGHYAATLAQLGMAAQVSIGDKTNLLQMEATASQFKATIKADGDTVLNSINDEGLILYPKKTP